MLEGPTYKARSRRSGRLSPTSNAPDRSDSSALGIRACYGLKSFLIQSKVAARQSTPLKDPLISSGCICMGEAVVLLNRGSFIEQYDRWSETYMHAVQGCQEFS